jgi:hypothetical protein
MVPPPRWGKGTGNDHTSPGQLPRQGQGVQTPSQYLLEFKLGAYAHKRGGMVSQALSHLLHA